MKGENSNFFENKNFKQHKKNKKTILSIFLFQSFICFFVYLVFIFVKITSFSRYSYLNDRIKYAIKGPTFKNLINETVFNLKEFFNNVKPIGVQKKYDENSKKDEKLENSQLENVKSEEKSNEKELEFENLCSSETEDDDVIFFNFKQPIDGKVSSKYGLRENPLSKGKKDFHYGVDIVACCGTPVLAIADGIVNVAAKSERSGNYISISHGEFYESLYAHCSKILIPQGSPVKKGDVIALSGNSGRVTGAHLHLGIKKNGNWIDPIEVFPNYLWLYLIF